MNQQPSVLEMRMKKRTLICVGALLASFVLAGRTDAQSRLPFEGVWEEISSVNPNRPGGANAGREGREGRAGAPGSTTTPNAMRRTFIDGYYSLSNAANGRKPLTKPVPEMTKEELLDRFQSLQVQDGTYEPMGPNRILIKRRVSQFPQNHNTEQVMEWKVTGDQLSLTIISDTGSAPVGQISTYKRLKK
jgi:hypothetical protein